MKTTQQVESASARLRGLPERLGEVADFRAAVAALADQGPATFHGVWGSSLALLAAALRAAGDVPLVVVCPRQADIDDFCDDLALFTAAQAERFPAWESAPDERIVHDEIYGDRLRALKLLLEPAARPLIATSIQSMLQPVPSKAAVESGTRLLRRGAKLDVEDLMRWLVEHGFHSTTAVQLPGEASLRGGILDVFAPDWYQPVRVELFDDEVESLRTFDIASQRSLETLAEVDITMLLPGLAEGNFFTDYLPDGAWLVLVEPEQAAAESEQYLSRLEQPGSCHSLEEVQQRYVRFSVATAGGLPQGSLGRECHLRIESVERFSGELSKVREELDRLSDGDEVFVVAPTEAETQRLREILAETEAANRGRLHFPLGSLCSGFRLVDEQVILVTADELFRRGDVRRAPQRRLGKVIDSFLDLRQGDLVVHLAHGIGRYRGLELLEKDQQVEEHLVIEFRGGTKIFVPATKIGLVQKYVGGSKSRPVLSRVGGKSWLRHKKAAEAAVQDVAADMLELQASRRSRPGISFTSDSEWQHEFEASFPYRETPDQTRAWQAMRSDMGVARPMDRLLCGDVGFGKTELAMRAAFNAVDNGYQVAVLVPTTILAEQHYQTFNQRMAEFPFDIGKLSRFCSPREQRETVAGLAAGRVDIVIGTHRLASRDVNFLNLGLVIIDEEQRFGVEVKERLKQLRATVDIVTMTATPIPRTLHMSLVGVRDICNLETAPDDRVAVETRVTRFDEALIRHAVLRELNRDGQVFFVHNRVQDIGLIAQKLQHIVPEARVRIGHGQMAEGELEKVMVDFVAHRFDVLLATTIVESGLDIPNANTIFVNEADRYGLADLHQLRGRVGRYKHRAYCYLLVEPHKHVTPAAAKRLRAIEEFSDIGAGFAIAMRDLEIRGAGNLLGTEQSGHIAAVGYELYCQLLENAIHTLKQQQPKLTIDVDIDLPGESYIPPSYVPDLRAKIDLYRRLSRLASFDDLGQLREELIDRFGAIPEAVRRLFLLAELRIDAAIWQISAVFLEQEYVVFRFADRQRIEQLARNRKPRLRIVDDSSAYLPIPAETADPDAILQLVKSMLQPN